MKRIYDFITKANQVLFFLTILGAITGICYLVYSEASRHFETPHVSVSDASNTIAPTVVRDVRFLGKSAGFYVFGIVKREINSAPESRKNGSMELFSSSGPRNNPGEIVNVVFSRGEQKARTLLPKDGLVLRHRLASSFDPEKLAAHLFTCVTEDMDGNHVLDSNDRQDLFILAKNLDAPDMVVTGVIDYDLVSPTHIVVKTREASGFRFVDIDVETQKKSEVLWK
jgi:hypothetical protein